MHIPGPTGNRPVNELFADAADYENYRLIKTSANYDSDASNILKSMTGDTVFQMKDRIVNVMTPVLMIISLQYGNEVYHD